MSSDVSEVSGKQATGLTPDQFRRVGRALLVQPFRPDHRDADRAVDCVTSDEWQADMEFLLAAAMILESGDDRGLCVNGDRYVVEWDREEHVPKAILRLPQDAEKPAAYDTAAEVYDSLYTSPEEREHEQSVMRALWSSVGDLTGKSVLDIGCGTGLFLDYNQPGRYLGIDPSGEMLKRLVEKHPDRAGDVIQAKLEEFVLPEGVEPFDVVISLYASVSYADPSYVVTIPDFAKRDGGQWFVMTYDEGYEPLVHEFCSDVQTCPGLPDGLLGDRVPFPSYEIRAGRHEVES